MRRRKGTIIMFIELYLQTILSLLKTNENFNKKTWQKELVLFVYLRLIDLKQNDGENERVLSSADLLSQNGSTSQRWFGLETGN